MNGNTDLGTLGKPSLTPCSLQKIFLATREVIPPRCKTIKLPKFYFFWPHELHSWLHTNSLLMEVTEWREMLYRTAITLFCVCAINITTDCIFGLHFMHQIELDKHLLEHRQNSDNALTQS